MPQKIYQIDAFTDVVFSGNPAAVCPLENWLSDALLQKIAFENNLAETAFYVRHHHHIEIRWFTPTIEVDLCGHATLATAYVLFNYEGFLGNTITFHSPRSGTLTVTQNNTLLTLNFPTDVLQATIVTQSLTNCFDLKPQFVFKGKSDYLFVYDTEASILKIQPNLNAISKLDARGVIVTAKGTNVDFVSRFFAPQIGINEDPVTGSAHTTLTPYWAKILHKSELSAQQLSSRGGFLQCKLVNNTVEISGNAKLYLIGNLFLE